MSLQSEVQRVVDEHGGIRPAARALRLSAAYLCRVLNGEMKNPTDAYLAKLGIERRVTYHRRYGRPNGRR